MQSAPSSAVIIMPFALGSATLSNQQKLDLDVVAASFRDGQVIELVGYTDPTGTEEYNRRLSHRRAQNVVKYLISAHPLQTSRVRSIHILGEGEDNPMVSNLTTTGQAINRRVMVYLGKGK